jgi:hypothetical protein
MNPGRLGAASCKQEPLQSSAPVIISAHVTLHFVSDSSLDVSLHWVCNLKSAPLEPVLEMLLELLNITPRPTMLSGLPQGSLGSPGNASESSCGSFKLSSWTVLGTVTGIKRVSSTFSIALFHLTIPRVVYPVQILSFDPSSHAA